MAKYIPAITSDGYHIVMMKTTVASPGDGDWDAQDDGVLVAQKGGDYNNTSPIISLWPVEDSSDIAVATQQANGRVAYHVFDPGTDAWTTTDEQVTVVGDTIFDSLPTQPGVSLALRSDGDVVVFYTYHETLDNKDGIAYARREAGSWTVGVETAAPTSARESRNPVAVGPDSSDRIACSFFVDEVTDSYRARILRSNNTLSATSTVESSVDTALFIIGRGVIDSANELYYPYIDGDNKIGVAQWTGADTIGVSTKTSVGDNVVFGNGRTTSPFVAACLAVDGTDVHLLYSDSTQDLFHDNDVDGGGATDNEELDAVTVNRISCNKGTSDLLFVYDDGGTTKYGAITLAAPGPGQPAMRRWGGVPGMKPGGGRIGRAW